MPAHLDAYERPMLADWIARWIEPVAEWREVVCAWLVGDLVEESGPPMYGSGSFPLEWPATVTALARRMRPDAAVVPGHGAAVERTFVAAQQADLQQVADVIVELHAAGVPAAEAPARGRGRWPFPEDGMAPAVADAYRQLDG